MTDWSKFAQGNGRDWYLAASLVALGNEVNARWPKRDDNSDGAIGDASHQARVSDHNPDWSAGGVVRAEDIDKDGLDVAELLDALTGDPRVSYVIWSRRMMRSYSKTIDGHTYKPWQWAPYDGPSPHTGHVHISIKHTRAAETNTAAWFKAAQPMGDDMANWTETALKDAVRDVLGEYMAGLYDATRNGTAGKNHEEIERLLRALLKQEADRYVYYANKFGEVLRAVAADDANDVTSADVDRIMVEVGKLAPAEATSGEDPQQ